jgi:hypothetical protein
MNSAVNAQEHMVRGGPRQYAEVTGQFLASVANQLATPEWGLPGIRRADSQLDGQLEAVGERCQTV